MADLYRDFVFTRNTTTVAAGDTAITVEDVSLFPSNALLAKSEFYIAFESSLSYPHTFEIMRLTNVNTSTKTLTVVRGQAGTTAQSHAIVTYIKGTLTSDMMRRARQGFSGTVAPQPDSDLVLQGDRFYHTSENRFYAYTGKAGYFRDTFTRAASTTTMGSTETQTVTTGNSVVYPAINYTVPYVGLWNPFNGIWGINASGQAYYVSGAVSNTALNLLNVGGTDFDISFDVFASTTTTSDYGLVFRFSVDGLYGYYLQFVNTTATLYRCNNGAFATTSQTTTYTSNATHTWRIVANGNVIQVYLDGVLKFTYTETLANFLVGAATYVPGGNVGMRIGNAAGLSDAALVWDNFLCTYPNNTAVNTPTPQGWAPTSGTTGTGSSSDALTNILSDISSLEQAVLATANQVDDIGPAVAGVEDTVRKHDVDIPAIASLVDDLTQVAADVETRGVNNDLILAATVNQVDDLLDTMRTMVGLSGNGPPTGTSVEGTLYADVLYRRLYIYSNGTWTPITWTGPGYPTTPSIIYRGGTTATATGGNISFPSGAVAGDIAVLCQTEYNGGPRQIPAPTGFTTAQYAYGPNQYWNSALLAYKVLTQADINTGYVTYTGFYEDRAVLRVYGNAVYDTSAQMPTSSYQASYTNSLTAPSVTTTAPNELVLSFFFAGGYSLGGFTSTPAISNIQTLVGGQSELWVGDEVIASPGATTARTATSIANGTVSSAFTLALKVSAPNPVYQPPGIPISKTANYTAQSGDFVLASATSGAITITAPATSGIASGATLLVKKTDATTNIVTVASTALIDGGSTFQLKNQYDSVSLLFDGTTWWVT